MNPIQFFLQGFSLWQRRAHGIKQMMVYDEILVFNKNTIF